MDRNKAIIDGFRKGEKECIKPTARDADLWIKIWEELHELAKRGIPLEVEQGTPHKEGKRIGDET